MIVYLIFNIALMPATTGFLDTKNSLIKTLFSYSILLGFHKNEWLTCAYLLTGGGCLK